MITAQFAPAALGRPAWNAGHSPAIRASGRLRPDPVFSSAIVTFASRLREPSGCEVACERYKGLEGC